MLHARFDEMMSEGAAELADLAARRTRARRRAGEAPAGALCGCGDAGTPQTRTGPHHSLAGGDQEPDRRPPREYAFARANLDDSLTLLSNAGDIYKTADDANRRLCNQALFKAIYVDEDNDVRVGYTKRRTTG